MGDMERVASCGRHMARDKQMGGARMAASAARRVWQAMAACRMWQAMAEC